MLRCAPQRVRFFCGWLLFWLLSGLGSFCVSVYAADVQTISVTHGNGEFEVSFDVVLDADYEKVWNLLKTHDSLQELSPAITRSEITIDGAGKTQLDIDLKACWLFFCKTLNKVSYTDNSVKGRLVYVAAAGRGSFSVADETLQLIQLNNKTKLVYNARLVPSIFIPPFIGPYAVRKAIESELKETANNTERLADQ